MEDEKTVDAIIDLMDMELGDSSAKQDVSARSKFNAFLTTVEFGRSFETLRKKDVTKELIGKFCSFLLQDSISWQTAMNYMSSIKRQLETTVRTDMFKKEPEWYKRCRRNLHQQFVLQAIKTGKRLKDQAAIMTLEDLEQMSRVLLLQNQTSALMDRTLLNNQWLSIGRSSDIGNLRFDDLHWLDRFLVIDVARLYQSDAGAVLTPNLQSHSARRGGAAHASSHGDVKLSDLAHRGLWSMDGFAILMEYISPTTSSDQTIAKVLGGWMDLDRAGVPPSLSCFQKQHHEARARVTEFAAILRRLYFSKVAKQGFADCLTATVLMYYDDTYRISPDHTVHTNMVNAARGMRLREATTHELKDWGRFIRKHFVLNNLLSLPVQYVKENMSERELSEQYVGIHTLSEALERGVAGYRQVVAELQDVKSLLHKVLDSLHSLDINGGAREHRQDHEVQTANYGHNSLIANQPSAEPMPLLGRSWPRDFTTVTDLLLQDLLVRYVRDGLAFAVRTPGNRVQEEGQSSMQIVREFVEMATLPSGQQHAKEALALVHHHALTEFARRVQMTIVAFIEQHRHRKAKRRNHSKSPPKKRSRPLTGMVTGVVTAWGLLDPEVRALTAHSDKLRFIESA